MKYERQSVKVNVKYIEDVRDGLLKLYDLDDYHYYYLPLMMVKKVYVYYNLLEFVLFDDDVYRFYNDS